MGCGGRSSRLFFDGFRRYNSISSRANLGESAISQNGVKKQWKSPFFDGGKKFYHGDSKNRAYESKARRGWRRWLWNLETSVGLVVFSGGVALNLYRGGWDTVPYTKRSQFVLLPASSDKRLGESRYAELKEIFKENVVPPLHPQSVRVRKVAQDLVEAFIRREGGDRSKRNWDVLLVDIPIHRTKSFPCGKILMFTGTIDSCKEDAEIAAFIAPEVGHAVARHAVESFSLLQILPCVFLLILHLLLSSMPSLVNHLRFPLARSLVYYMTYTAISYLLQKFYSIKMDLEADYIGLVLVASAGYDPRVALSAREKKGTSDGEDWEKMRARLLFCYMEEALSIYREVMDSRDV